MIYILIFISSFLYSQCSSYIEFQCINDESCQWIEDVEYGSCSSLAWQICNDYPGCYVDSEPGWYDSSGPYCAGGNYQIDNSYCQEVSLPECSEMNNLECGQNENCEWIEDIEYGNCSQLGEDACNANSNCTFDCEMYHGSCAGCCWGDCLGGNYQIDNSYCQDISVELPDCSDLSESLCNDDNYGQGCEWFEDTYYINCNNLSDNQCNNYEECSLQQGECLQWGSWYTWICYQYDYYCVGGEVEVNNGYCEEIIYELGDINGDYSIDILDVIESINFILVGSYNSLADINNDNNMNILDVILLIDLILNN